MKNCEFDGCGALADFDFAVVEDRNTVRRGKFCLLHSQILETERTYSAIAAKTSAVTTNERSLCEVCDLRINLKTYRVQMRLMAYGVNRHLLIELAYQEATGAFNVFHHERRALTVSSAWHKSLELCEASVREIEIMSTESQLSCHVNLEIRHQRKSAICRAVDGVLLGVVSDAPLLVDNRLLLEIDEGI